MPKRSRSGLVSMPARVVAPTSVNGCRSSLIGTRGRALADHDVDLVVLQRRIQDLLDDRRQAVDLVDEQHVVALRGWSGCAARSPGRSSTGPEVWRRFTPSSARDDVGQRGLAQARRAEQQHVVERLAALAGGADEDLELLARPSPGRRIRRGAWAAARARIASSFGEAGAASMMRCSVKLSVWMLICVSQVIVAPGIAGNDSPRRRGSKFACVSIT